MSYKQLQDVGGIMLQHSRHADNKRSRISVAGLYNPETKSLSFGVSKCFRDDNFCRKTGRELATGRLDLLGSNPTMKLTVEPEADIQRLFRNKFNQIESFLQRNGIKKINLPLDQGGLDNTPGVELLFETESKSKSSSVEAEITM